MTVDMCWSREMTFTHHLVSVPTVPTSHGLPGTIHRCPGTGANSGPGPLQRTAHLVTVNELPAASRNQYFNPSGPQTVHSISYRIVAGGGIYIVGQTDGSRPLQN